MSSRPYVNVLFKLIIILMSLTIFPLANGQEEKPSPVLAEEHASTSDNKIDTVIVNDGSKQEFEEVFNAINGHVSGLLGKTIALFMILVGIAAAVVRQSIFPIIFAISFSQLIKWLPEISEVIFDASAFALLLLIIPAILLPLGIMFLMSQDSSSDSSQPDTQTAESDDPVSLAQLATQESDRQEESQKYLQPSVVLQNIDNEPADNEKIRRIVLD